MGDLDVLVDMGFPREKAEYAMKVTNNRGIEPAMEWLLAHADEDIPESESSAAGNAVGSAAAATATARAAADSAKDDTTSESSCTSEAAAAGADIKSFKCDDCGRLARDASDMEFHAVKSGHKNFSESHEEKPPLTDVDKKEQLVIIEQKLKQKRIEREERENAEAVERERNRIRSGKDMTEARKRMEELEMKKIVEQRKREKAEEKAARDRVRAQIEADKAARKAREGGGNGGESEAAPCVTSTTPSLSPSQESKPKPTQSPTMSSLSSSTKDYTQTRIQIRLQDGSTLTETFGVKEQLSAVRVFIQVKTGNELPFGLMTSFPRKVFDDEDFEKPLEVLGLVPSAVLIMTKSQA